MIESNTDQQINKLYLFKLSEKFAEQREKIILVKA